MNCHSCFFLWLPWILTPWSSINIRPWLKLIVQWCKEHLRWLRITSDSSFRPRKRLKIEKLVRKFEKKKKLNWMEFLQICESWVFVMRETKNDPKSVFMSRVVFFPFIDPLAAHIKFNLPNLVTLFLNCTFLKRVLIFPSPILFRKKLCGLNDICVCVLIFFCELIFTDVISLVSEVRLFVGKLKSFCIYVFTAWDSQTFCFDSKINRKWFRY